MPCEAKVPQERLPERPDHQTLRLPPLESDILSCSNEPGEAEMVE